MGQPLGERLSGLPVEGAAEVPGEAPGEVLAEEVGVVALQKEKK